MDTFPRMAFIVLEPKVIYVAFIIIISYLLGIGVCINDCAAIRMAVKPPILTKGNVGDKIQTIFIDLSILF